MKIVLERSGGFTGIPLVSALDLDKLPLADCEELEGLVRSAGFFDLPEKLPTPPGGVDRFQYRLTIDELERKHTVEMGDDGIPEELQELIRRVNRLARSMRRG
jgi:hypothetical protein